MRVWLAGLIVLATIGFAVGTSIERHDSNHESAAQLRSEQGRHPAPTQSGAAGAAEHHAEAPGTLESATPGEADESAASRARELAGSPTEEPHRELRPLGVNVEAVPFVVLACLLSLALAALAWLRPRWLPGLVLTAGVIAAFGVLDIREALHQSDEHRAGLMILAAVIAALHLAAAGVAVAMAARRDAQDSPGRADTIAA